MGKFITLESWLISLITFLLAFHHVHSFREFKCPDKGEKAPELPKSYSTNIRINYMKDKYTAEVKYATNSIVGHELFEFKRQGRHVSYITRYDQKSTLFIQYKEDEHPTCKTIGSHDRKEFLEKEDAGENRIILKAAEVMMYPNIFGIFSSEPSFETGVFARRYEGCLSDPKINISISFAESEWKQPYSTALNKNVAYPEMAVADIDGVLITAFYSYFDPSEPDDSVFQPPADVYCDGYRADKTPPKLKDYFSYNAEIIVYESAMGVSPMVSQRKVYYDQPSGISRMDFDDPLAESPDMFSEVSASEKTIVHDYNAGIQYIFDPFSGKCTIDTFEATFNAISYELREDNKMLNGLEYFWLDGASTSYNGQFPIRGMTADVYTALKVDPATKKRSVVSWYFSTEDTRIAESENVEKNVLLRMYVRPETDMDKKGVTEINFYNFVKEQPNIFTFDLTSCYNESNSKVLVFVFPAVDSLRGLEKMIGGLIHLAIKDATGVRKQRIYTKEVIFKGGYMYAEFSLLDALPVKRKTSGSEITLDDAVKKLQSSVSFGNFSIKVPLDKETVTLKPEPDGFHVFSGYSIRESKTEGYKEGSVIGLTIGMLILGFLLGGVTLNLVMSRKFGISLFQKSTYAGGAGFGNPLNESSM